MNWVPNVNAPEFVPRALYNRQEKKGIVLSYLPASAQPQASTDINAAKTSVIDHRQVIKWITQLTDSKTREEAIFSLAKNRDALPEMAEILWFSFGTVAFLIHEIVSSYEFINPPSLTEKQSIRVCQSMALLQTIASNTITRRLLVNTQMLFLLYPIIQANPKSKPIEILTLTGLGIIGAIVKHDEPEVINFFVTTEFVPLCLKVMETGFNLTKTVGAFILQKILMDPTGLMYVCNKYDRFWQVVLILRNIIRRLPSDPCPRLLKHVIRCYCRLLDNSRAFEALKPYFPEKLKDSTFVELLKDDKITLKWLFHLQKRIETNANGLGTIPESYDMGPSLVRNINSSSIKISYSSFFKK